MKQTKNTRVVSGGIRGGGVLAGRKKGSGSHSGEWKGGGVLAGARGKAMAVTCTWAGIASFPSSSAPCALRVITSEC